MDRRVRAEIDHRVTHHLHIIPIDSYAMVRAYTTIRTVHTRAIRIMLLFGKKRIGMDIGVMFLVRPIHHQRTVRRKTAAVLLPHLTHIAVKRCLARGINDLHLTECIPETAQFIVKNLVSGHHFSIRMVNDRTVIQRTAFRLRIIPSARGVNIRFLLIDDIRRTH